MLFEEALETFNIITETTQADGYGGQETIRSTGESFQAVAVQDGGQEQLVAMQLGWNGSYTVITHKDTTLMDGDIIRRASDSKCFRIKADGTDYKTPASAGLNMRAVKAEGYILG